MVARNIKEEQVEQEPESTGSDLVRLDEQNPVTPDAEN
jgi:hypothetical protein